MRKTYRKNKPKYHQGFYKPINPSKYKGESWNIIFRSNLELKCFEHIDLNRDVLKWNSEEVVVPYLSPIDNRYHRYFVDLWIQTAKGQFIIEIKPYKLVEICGIS